MPKLELHVNGLQLRKGKRGEKSEMAGERKIEAAA